MTNPVTIRSASAADARVIAEIRVASWRATYAGIVPSSVLDRMSVERNEAWLADRLAHEGGAGTLVVETEADGRREVAGYALLSACQDDDAPGLGEVQAIYLRPDARGRGLGRPLFEAALIRLSELGFGTAVLWVLEANAPARRFYARTGFAPDGATRMLDFDGTPIEEIRLRRSTAEPSYHQDLD